jgi:putative serine protease PepD
MDVGKAAGPKWWSRPEDTGPDGTPGAVTAGPAAPVVPERPDASGMPDVPEAPTGPGAPRPAEPVAGNPYATPPHAATPSGSAPAAPLHAPDPYDTPPYGEPGPWAPAPPVQHPAGGYAPLPPAPEPPLSVGQWHRYDPWAAPGTPSAAERPQRRGRGGLAALLLLVAVVAGSIGGAIGASLRRDAGAAGGVSLPPAPAQGATREPGSVAGIAARTLPGVVYIHVKGSAGEDTGTGFVLDQVGHVLTNNHVVEPAAKGGTISVTFDDGRVRTARTVGRDSGYDLAVIKADGMAGTGPRPLTLGDSDSVKVGDPVVAIGAPFGLKGTVTSGIISATHRPITAGGATDVSYVDALQTDAPINPGNSGGPLVDAQGRVIGINSAIRSVSSGSDPFGTGTQGGSIGLGFAIPVNQAKRVAGELIRTGHATHPVIGASLNPAYTGDGAQVAAEGANGAPAISPDGPAAAAGLRPGDVVTEVDGTPVHGADELIVRIRSHRPGDRLTLMVRRGAADRTVSVTLGSAKGS